MKVLQLLLCSTLFYCTHTYLIGFKYLQPPPLPSNYVDRPHLLKEIATKLLQATLKPNTYGATVTITGPGGFGKTHIVTLLCHHPDVKQRFSDGFIFIGLGPQGIDPSIKLSKVYHLLTGEHIKEGDIDQIQQEIIQLTSLYYRNLLVIIDDVWHVEDAVPLVKAFSNCKIILTTRMNNLEQYIPSSQSVVIGSMELNEAFSLLTSGIIDTSQLSQEDEISLNKLAQDVHLYPLLLSLIRGQMSHNLKHCHIPYHEAIKNVRDKLYNNGLKAFDKNCTDSKITLSRQFAVKVCIDLTLELLTKSLSDKLKSLIIWTGVGTSLPVAVLNDLWDISEDEVENIVYQLWAYGLIQYTNITISFNNNTQNYVEIHAVICEYIFESIDSKEANTLAKVENGPSISHAFSKAFKQSYGINNISSLTRVDYLKYTLSLIENAALPYFFKTIIMHTFTSPHAFTKVLKDLQPSMKSKYVLLPISDKIKAFNEASLLIADSECIGKNIHKLYRKLNQRNLFEKNYDKLIQNVENFIKDYPLCDLAQKVANLMKKIIPYCEGELLQFMQKMNEFFEIQTHDYNGLTTLTLPYIKFHVEVHKRITRAIETGSPDVKIMYDYVATGKINEDYEFIRSNHLIKLQEVAPNHVHSMALNW